jgi:predicted DNA-binding transcriptional regulator YafY
VVLVGVHGDAAFLVERRFGKPPQPGARAPHAEDPATWPVLTAEITHVEALIAWALEWAPRVEILAPSALRREVEARLRRCAAAQREGS